MQFPIVNYKPISEDMQKSLNIYNQMMEALSAPEHMKMAQQLQNAQISQMQANTQGQNLRNQYYPQVTQADIDSRQASTAQTKAQTDDIPFKDTLDILKAMSPQSGGSGRYDDFSKMQRFAQTPEGKNALAKNPTMAKNYYAAALQKSQNAANPQQGNNWQQAILMQMLQQKMPKGMQLPATPDQNAPQNTPAPYTATDTGFVDTSGNPVPVSALPTDMQGAAKDISDAQISAFQEAANDSFEKSTNTSNTLVQRKALTSLNNTMEEAKKHMDGYLKFINGAKKAHVLASKFAMGLGKNDPNFNDYNIMTTTVFPTMSGEYRKMVGGQASDAEQNFINSIVDPDAWWYDEDGALAKLNSVHEMAQGFARSLGASQSQTAKQIQEIKESPAAFFSKDQALQINPDQQKKLSNQVGTQLANNLGMKAPKTQQNSSSQFETKMINGQLMIRKPGKAWVPAGDL